jgi:hypothetical protein
VSRDGLRYAAYQSTARRHNVDLYTCVSYRVRSPLTKHLDAIHDGCDQLDAANGGHLLLEGDSGRVRTCRTREGTSVALGGKRDGEGGEAVP